MLLVLLVACVRLKEGDYGLDYDPVKLDTCNLYDGGQVSADTTGELAWEEDELVFELDGTDDDLVFEVEDTDFTRESFGLVPLDDNCALATVQDDEGTMLSDTDFEGETRLTADFQGDCVLWEIVFDPPCLVEFDWEGTYAD
ncbi:MAG: hypothetical protein Q8P41_13730 [Pseudomonadota bacterium]|nr:hypothetical protein [Pseudomonadota bacterium]